MGAVAAKILESELAKRSTGAVPATDIVLDVPAGAGNGFEIAGPPGGPIRIIGDKPAGLFPGIGKFLRTSRWTQAGFEPSTWRGRSSPDKPVRGIYFATHFHNFYHDAPIDEVARVIEQLALWGCNALNVWFDMHDYRGINDPDARAMIARLHAILRAANRVGIGAAMGVIADEGYDDSPVALRADWTAGHDGYHTAPGGHYHREVCPSKPGGLDYILRTRREMLEAFADLDIRWLAIGPYDQGGCTCRECAPWGVNGFLRTADAVAGMVKEVMPAAEIILSTWYFDHFTSGEWEGFARRVAEKRPAWMNTILADDNGDQYPPYILEHGVPGGMKLINFPEISMYHMFPWGGYGANPLPTHFQKLWDVVGEKLSGGFPYSEGIYEDINKVAWLQYAWSGRKTLQSVRDYASNYFGADSADALSEIAVDLEARHGRGIALPRGVAAATFDAPIDSPDAAVAFRWRKEEGANLKGADACLQKVLALEKALPDAARADWRWRLVHLRASIDAELTRTNARLSDDLDAMFRELATMYHADRAYWVVAPPTRTMLRRYFVEGNFEQI